MLKLLAESLNVERHLDLTLKGLPKNKSFLFCLFANRKKLKKDHQRRKVDYKSKVHNKYAVSFTCIVAKQIFPSLVVMVC